MYNINLKFVNRTTGAPLAFHKVVVCVGHTCGRAPIAIYADEAGASLISQTGEFSLDASGVLNCWTQNLPKYDLAVYDDGDALISVLHLNEVNVVDVQSANHFSELEIQAVRSHLQSGPGEQGSVVSVNGRQGEVVLTKADVALDQVDNTSDANKPISTATATALAGLSASIDNQVNGVTLSLNNLETQVASLTTTVSSTQADSAAAVNTANAAVALSNDNTTAIQELQAQVNTLNEGNDATDAAQQLAINQLSDVSAAHATQLTGLANSISTLSSTTTQALSSLQSQVTSASDVANTASSQAANAVATATSASSVASTAASQASSAASQAATAASTASSALAQASSASTQAASAATSASTALSTANQAAADMLKVDIVEKTGSATLALSDAGKQLDVNSASTSTVTIPTEATVAFPIGTRISVCQAGAGTVTIAAAAGVTILKPSTVGFNVAEREEIVMLHKKGANTWRLNGALNVLP